MATRPRESWEQQVERDPAAVLRLVATGEYVPFSIRLELERRGLFDLNTETYGVTPAGTDLLRTTASLTTHTPEETSDGNR